MTFNGWASDVLCQAQQDLSALDDAIAVTDATVQTAPAGHPWLPTYERKLGRLREDREVLVGVHGGSDRGDVGGGDGPRVRGKGNDPCGTGAAGSVSV